jgi:uncharacterized protein YutE (UPF0331/DUF86 family)
LVDAESVRSRLDHLGELLEELDAIQAGGRDAYVAELRTRLAAQHALQLAIQACIDVGAHVIAELGLSAPDDYRGVFENLTPAGLDSRLATRMAAAAGMRNVLVHAYLEVDDEAVWSALSELDDMRQFAAAVQQMLDAGPSTAGSQPGHR